jgi:hypothetical protein
MVALTFIQVFKPYLILAETMGNSPVSITLNMNFTYHELSQKLTERNQPSAMLYFRCKIHLDKQRKKINWPQDMLIRKGN